MDEHDAKVIKICATGGVLRFEGPVGALWYSAAGLRAAAGTPLEDVGCSRTSASS